MVRSTRRRIVLSNTLTLVREYCAEPQKPDLLQGCLLVLLIGIFLRICRSDRLMTLESSLSLLVMSERPAPGMNPDVVGRKYFYCSSLVWFVVMDDPVASCCVAIIGCQWTTTRFCRSVRVGRKMRSKRLNDDM
ncbi:hypothetical protein RND81_13G199600 [Saponaria officinalis]|uniref:Uncharacterized protein n=1 Tax=Saponaria officinalis TaxID=3572 RepID=A0AAW1H3H0_SAPOF